MTTHATISFDSHSSPLPPSLIQSLYSNRTYARTKTTTITTTSHAAAIKRTIPSCRKTSPHIDICENLLYDIATAADVGSATSSSYINSSDHYDNTYNNNTYDNPIQYFEKYPSKSIDRVRRSYDHLPHSNENFYDHAKADDGGEDTDDSSPSTTRSLSPAFFYLENKNLAICACIISLLLLLLVALGIFLLNKFLRPVIINTTVNNHYGLFNTTNTTTSTSLSTRPNSSTQLMMVLKQASSDVLLATSRTLLKETPPLICPSDRWGKQCEHICKPCGLGVCHPATGLCICPADIYGEFCDLWKINDKPKRGDMSN